MVKILLKGFFSLVFAAFLFSCSSTNSKPLLIAFSDDSTSIVFKNITQAGLLQLKNSKHADSAWSGLISVIQTPSEGDPITQERPVGGTIIANDSSIIFTPDKPFSRGTEYLVITYLNVSFGNTEKLLKGELSYGVKPQQKIVRR